jgi:hypothetical protein
MLCGPTRSRPEPERVHARHTGGSKSRRRVRRSGGSGGGSAGNSGTGNTGCASSWIPSPGDLRVLIVGRGIRGIKRRGEGPL